MSTGQRMKARRKELGLSAEYIANQLNLSPATIYRYENGDIDKVPGDILEPLAAILQTTPAHLMGWDDYSNPIEFTVSTDELQKYLTEEDSTKHFFDITHKIRPKAGAKSSKKAFAENLQHYMDQAGIDQNKLCEDLNFKYSTVSGWLSAEKYPRIDKIEILSHYFGIKKADLVEDNNKTDKLGRIFVDVTTALNLNIPEMQEDLGVDRKTIERLIINKNTFLKKEFKLLEETYGVPVSVWAGEKTFGAWFHALLHSQENAKIYKLYAQLNPEGQAKAVDMLDDMVLSGKYST